MTIRHLLLILVLIASPLATATADERHELEILNRQVWLPYQEGIRTDKPELYVGVHSEDFYWVAPGSKGRIMSLREYDEDSRQVMAQRKTAGERTEIEFRFLERNVRNGFAAEKVVTKFTLRRRDGTAQSGYRIAHYFSRKEDGVWKIVLQYGSTEAASEETFAKAARLS